MVAKLKEQLKQHEEAVKETKGKMAAVRTELDATVEDVNDAQKRDPGEGGDDVAGERAQVLEQVRGPTPQEVGRHTMLAKANPTPKLTHKPAAPVAKKACMGATAV